MTRVKMADNFDQIDPNVVLEKDIRNITNRLTNVTIGEIIDKRKEDNEKILKLIEERK